MKLEHKPLKVKEKFHDYEMEQQGIFFEQALYDKGYDFENFLDVYMNSIPREMMDSYHGRLSDTDPRVLWNYLTQVDKTIEFKKADKPLINRDVAYWIGAAYSYLHYYTSLSFKELYSLFKLKDMLGFYVCGHQLSWEQFAKRLISEYNEYHNE